MKGDVVGRHGGQCRQHVRTARKESTSPAFVRHSDSPECKRQANTGEWYRHILLYPLLLSLSSLTTVAAAAAANSTNASNATLPSSPPPTTAYVQRSAYGLGVFLLLATLPCLFLAFYKIAIAFVVRACGRRTAGYVHTVEWNYRSGICVGCFRHRWDDDRDASNRDVLVQFKPDISSLVDRARTGNCCVRRCDASYKWANGEGRGWMVECVELPRKTCRRGAKGRGGRMSLAQGMAVGGGGGGGHAALRKDVELEVMYCTTCCCTRADVVGFGYERFCLGMWHSWFLLLLLLAISGLAVWLVVVGSAVIVEGEGVGVGAASASVAGVGGSGMGSGAGAGAAGAAGTAVIVARGDGARAVGAASLSLAAETLATLVGHNSTDNRTNSGTFPLPLHTTLRVSSIQDLALAFTLTIVWSALIVFCCCCCNCGELRYNISSSSSTRRLMRIIRTKRRKEDEAQREAQREAQERGAQLGEGEEGSAISSSAVKQGKGGQSRLAHKVSSETSRALRHKSLTSSKRSPKSDIDRRMSAVYALDGLDDASERVMDDAVYDDVYDDDAYSADGDSSSSALLSDDDGDLRGDSDTTPRPLLSDALGPGTDGGPSGGRSSVEMRQLDGLGDVVVSVTAVEDKESCAGEPKS